MAKSLKIQLAELQADYNQLLGKLRAQIAQANRYFERMKLLETENRMLQGALRDAGIEPVPHFSKMGMLRARVMELGVKHGMSNVRIKGGIIELRTDGVWIPATDGVAG